MTTDSLEPRDGAATSRRRALKIGAAAGVAVWTAPVILSGTAGAGAPPSGLTLGPNVIVDPGFDIP